MGPVIAWHPIDTGAQARVWRIVGEHEVVLLKCHRSPGAWARERDAYGWLIALQGNVVPRLVGAVQRPIPALLLSELPGESAASAHLDAHDRRIVHRRAGEIRARLDRVPCPADPLPLERAYARRFEHWHAHADGRVPAEPRRRAAALFDPSVFAGCQRVICHRDFMPSNWLVEREPAGLRVRVVDLGQARPDIAWLDLVKLREGPWQREPELERSFLAGWGVEPNAEDRLRLDHLGLLHGLATASWAHAHRDAALFREGLQVLERRANEIEKGSRPVE